MAREMAFQRAKNKRGERYEKVTDEKRTMR
mgnify:CR=1 FL=1